MHQIFKRMDQKAPKTDLHVHSRSSVRIETILAIQKRKISLPPDHPDQLREMLVMKDSAILVDYLRH